MRWKVGGPGRKQNAEVKGLNVRNKGSQGRGCVRAVGVCLQAVGKWDVWGNGASTGSPEVHVPKSTGNW